MKLLLSEERSSQIYLEHNGIRTVNTCVAILVRNLSVSLIHFKVTVGVRACASIGSKLSRQVKPFCNETHAGGVMGPLLQQLPLPMGPSAASCSVSGGLGHCPNHSSVSSNP